MKVAVVCPYAFDAHGGVQDQVARIVRWLRDAGHEAWAVAPGSGGPDGTRHVGRFRNLPANRSKAPISLDLRIRGRVAAAVEDADVVHVHEPFMPMVSLGAVLADTPPAVGTFHADPGKVARTFYRGAAVALGRLVRRLDVVTAVSDVAAGAIAPFVRPRIVPNGIDLESYEVAGVDRVPGRVLFVGRDDPRKGLDVLLAAWPTICETHSDATLHVVGTERSDEPGVSFLGRVSEERKAEELASASVMVTPNLGGESFGIVVLEGLASGCAVVASELDAFRAVAGGAAAYVPVGDPDALATEVAALLGSPERLAALGIAGRERSRRFGREEVLRGYLEAYELALSGS
jgi:phosphatidylinositol alpha-mannosyltransferase